jgi:PQQ-dependent catabolism-associated CXXCW motif protein
MHALSAAISFLVLLAVSAAPLAVEVDEPEGYRLGQYRAPTPPSLTGATTLDTRAAERLWREKNAVFVDVMPHDPKPANLPAGTVWRERRRDNIPGSVWLANVGYGVLSPEMELYFRLSLEEVTAGDQGRTLVFYCDIDCWMSWNAAKRAMAYGYSNIAWYPDGTDGWEGAKLPTEEAQPELRPEQ